MLAKRIIPCLDVTGGRVVKGVNFVELRDAGDPVEIAARYNAQGADELTFLDITATSDAATSSCTSSKPWPARCSFRSPWAAACARWKMCAACSTRARTNQLQFGRHCQPRRHQRRHRPNTAPSASWWPLMPSAALKKTRCASAPAAAGGPWLGCLQPRRAQEHGLDALAWAQEMASAALAKLLTSMDRDGTKSGFDLALTRAVSDAVSVPVIASGGVGNPTTLPTACSRAVPMPCWLPASSTTASTPWARPSSAWQSVAFPCVCNRHLLNN